MSGLEVVGSVASVLQLAATVYSISKTLYEVGDALSNAPSDIKDLARDLETFSEELHLLSSLLEGKNGRYSDRVYRLTAKIIGDCATICQKIDRVLKKLRSGSLWARVKWVYKEKEIMKLLARLRDLKLSLMGTLSLLSALKADTMMDAMGVGSSSLLEGAKDEKVAEQTAKDLEDARQKLARITVDKEQCTSQTKTLNTQSARAPGSSQTMTVSPKRPPKTAPKTRSTALPISDPSTSAAFVSFITLPSHDIPIVNKIMSNPTAMESVDSFHSAVSSFEHDNLQMERCVETNLLTETSVSLPHIDYVLPQPAPYQEYQQWRDDTTDLAMKHFKMTQVEARAWAASLPIPKVVKLQGTHGYSTSPNAPPTLAPPLILGSPTLSSQKQRLEYGYSHRLAQSTIMNNGISPDMAHAAASDTSSPIISHYHPHEMALQYERQQYPVDYSESAMMHNPHPDQEDVHQRYPSPPPPLSDNPYKHQTTDRIHGGAPPLSPPKMGKVPVKQRPQHPFSQFSQSARGDASYGMFENNFRPMKFDISYPPPAPMPPPRTLTPRPLNFGLTKFKTPVFINSKQFPSISEHRVAREELERSFRPRGSNERLTSPVPALRSQTMCEANDLDFQMSSSRRVSWRPEQTKYRVPRDCVQCRSKHLKCDGLNPCTRCSSKSIECVYRRISSDLLLHGSTIDLIDDSVHPNAPTLTRTTSNVLSGSSTPPDQRLISTEPCLIDPRILYEGLSISSSAAGDDPHEQLHMDKPTPAPTLDSYPHENNEEHIQDRHLDTDLADKSAFSISKSSDEWLKISSSVERRRVQNGRAQLFYHKKLKRRPEDVERRAGSSSASPPLEDNVMNTQNFDRDRSRSPLQLERAGSSSATGAHEPQTTIPHREICTLTRTQLPPSPSQTHSMMPHFESEPELWALELSMSADSHKRALSDDFPGANEYPKDRHWDDKMQEALDDIEKSPEGQGQEEGQQKRREKRHRYHSYSASEEIVHSPHLQSEPYRPLVAQYPSLPSVPLGYSPRVQNAPTSTLGTNFDSDPRRRYSGGMLQRQGPHSGRMMGISDDSPTSSLKAATTPTAWGNESLAPVAVTLPSMINFNEAIKRGDNIPGSDPWDSQNGQVSNHRMMFDAMHVGGSRNINPNALSSMSITSLPAAAPKKRGRPPKPTVEKSDHSTSVPVTLPSMMHFDESTKREEDKPRSNVNESKYKSIGESSFQSYSLGEPNSQRNRISNEGLYILAPRLLGRRGQRGPDPKNAQPEMLLRGDYKKPSKEPLVTETQAQEEDDTPLASPTESNRIDLNLFELKMPAKSFGSSLKAASVAKSPPSTATSASFMRFAVNSSGTSISQNNGQISGKTQGIGFQRAARFQKPGLDRIASKYGPFSSSERRSQLWWRALVRLQDRDFHTTCLVEYSWQKAKDTTTRWKSDCEVAKSAHRKAEDIMDLMCQNLDAKDTNGEAINGPILSSINRIRDVMKVIHETLNFKVGAFVWVCLCQAVENVHNKKGNSKDDEFLFAALAELATLVARYNIMESMYQQWQGMTLEAKYEELLVFLCTQVLIFLAAFVVPSPEIAVESLTRSMDNINKADADCRGFSVTFLDSALGESIGTMSDEDSESDSDGTLAPFSTSIKRRFEEVSEAASELDCVEFEAQNGASVETHGMGKRQKVRYA